MNTIKLRPVRLDDKNDLLAWANDPETMNSRFNKRPISIQEHEAWFNRSLSNPGRMIYLAEDEGGNKLGAIRLDRLSERVIEYDINVAPIMRGKGYSASMIAAASELYKPEQRGLLFIARIKKSNPRSKAAFLKAGCQALFTYTDRDQGEIEILGKIRL